MELTQEIITTILAPILIPHNINPEFSVIIGEDQKPDFTKDFRIILATNEFVYAYLLVFPNEQLVFLMEASQGKALYKGDSFEEACQLLKESLKSPSPILPN